MKTRIKKTNNKDKAIQYKNTLNKKSQLKMVETIAVMFVFFILLVLGIVFYSRIQAVGIKEELEEKFIKKAIGISQIVAFLPETQCSQENVVTDNCFDLYKLKGFNAVVNPSVENKLYYYDQFGYADIAIQIIYPTNQPSIVLYNHPKPDWKRITNFPTPVSVYDPTTGRNQFGVLMIKVYQ